MLVVWWYLLSFGLVGCFGGRAGFVRVAVCSAG